MPNGSLTHCRLQSALPERQLQMATIGHAIVFAAVEALSSSKTTRLAYNC